RRPHRAPARHRARRRAPPRTPSTAGEGTRTSNLSSDRSGLRPRKKRWRRAEPFGPCRCAGIRSGFESREHASTPLRRVHFGRSGFAARAGCLEPLEISLPERLTIRAQVVEVVPGINAGAMPVGKMRLQRLYATRFLALVVYVLSCYILGFPTLSL